MKVKLQHVAHCRSGDKGDTSNIAVFAYEPQLYPLLREQLTAERFKAYYAGAIKGPVTRYEAENLHAMNFVCQGALGGGVSRSLCLDTMGRRCPPPFWGSSLTSRSRWRDCCTGANRSRRNSGARHFISGRVMRAPAPAAASTGFVAVP